MGQGRFVQEPAFDSAMLLVDRTPSWINRRLAAWAQCAGCRRIAARGMCGSRELAQCQPHRDEGSNNHVQPTSERTMTYHTILVLLDQGPQRAARSHAAIRLAKALDCHLVGLAPIGVRMPVAGEAAASGAEFAARGQGTPRDQAGRTTERFLDECKKAGVRSFDATIDEADMASSLVRHAHCSDLTILTKADPAAPDHRTAQELVEHVVLNSARPTLVLPCAGRFDTIGTIGTNVMVAWDDSRAAARALSDALPLLRLAKHVQLVTWKEGGVNGDEVLRARCDELRQWLVRHAVLADVSIESTDIDVVEAMLSHAADLRTDLIVMGAYGHTRSSHVQDGTTRGLLAAIEVPILFSH